MSVKDIFKLKELSEDQLKAKLKDILSSMDIPSKRIHELDIRWLNRNLAIRNTSHKDYREAKWIISFLLKKESEKILKKGKINER